MEIKQVSYLAKAFLVKSGKDHGHNKKRDARNLSKVQVLKKNEMQEIFQKYKDMPNQTLYIFLLVNHS